MRLDIENGVREDYPQRPFDINHDLASSELLRLASLREAARKLPSEMVEVLDAPGLSAPQACGGGADSLIAELGKRRAWVMLRNLEQLTPYRTLIEELCESLRASHPWVLEGADRFMCFAFLSSPRMLTPLHIDPEHNFLLQISGRKQIALSDPLERRLPSEAQLQDFFADEVGFELRADGDWDPYLHESELHPGQGVFIPHLAPHLVRNGESVSISFSFTFRSAITDRAGDSYRPRDGGRALRPSLPW